MNTDMLSVVTGSIELYLEHRALILIVYITIGLIMTGCNPHVSDAEANPATEIYVHCTGFI